MTLMEVVIALTGNSQDYPIVYICTNTLQDAAIMKPVQEIAWAEGEILRETRPTSLRVRFVVKIA